MSPAQALLWKEWTEHRWKLAFGAVMLVSFGGSLLAWGGISNREAVILVLAVGCLVLALLNAMGTFAEEHSEGTTLFLATRPIESWKIFLEKWMVGWMTMILPLLACGLTLGVWFGLSHASGSVVRYWVPGTLVVAWIATMLYSLTCCVTPRRGGPAGVALTGLGWAGVMVLHLVVSEVVLTPVLTPSLFRTLFFFANPICTLALIDPPPWFKNAPGLLMAIGIVEQGILLAAILWAGLRNWKRSV
jgi:hypothetical protein